MSRLTKVMVAIPLLAGLTASLLFLAQGGFGGGHGKFDGLIVVLGLPTVLMSESAPLPNFITRHDFFLIVALPTVMNTLLFFLVAQIIKDLKRSK